MNELIEKVFSRDDMESEYRGGFNDFYVFERLIKNTGEIFYADIGRENRYKEYREYEFDTNRVMDAFDTETRFVAEGLTAEEAYEILDSEIRRVFRETDYVLTNINGQERSPRVPAYKFETAPVLYVTNTDEHFFNYKLREFDVVDERCLIRPAFIKKGLGWDTNEIIYGGEYEKYYNEVMALLGQNGSTIRTSMYAKSVTAWIYPMADNVKEYDLYETKAEERLGRRIPAYHMIDVWKFLKDKYGTVMVPEQPCFEIKPVHSRVPLSEVRNRYDREKGFDEGFEIWKEGEAERKNGNIKKAIQLFDLARYHGYLAPVLYDSYAVLYRKINDLYNEIDILNEAIEVLRTEKRDNSELIIKYEERKKKAVEKLRKRARRKA